MLSGYYITADVSTLPFTLTPNVTVAVVIILVFLTVVPVHARTKVPGTVESGAIVPAVIGFAPVTDNDRLAKAVPVTLSPQTRLSKEAPLLT